MPERLAIGMMSGTSCDGIDAAVVAVAGCGLDMKARLIAHVHRAFAPALRERLLAIMAPAQATVDELLSLSVGLANAHIPVVKAAIAKALEPDSQIPVAGFTELGSKTRASKFAVIGVHGQTICHRPPQKPGKIGASWQLGQFAPLAAALSIPVVCDFRAADLAVAGQGAPLVPWTDLVLAGHPTMPRVLINLGGVCNATFLPAGSGPDEVRAGDIGPCNILLDGLITRRTNGKETFDRNGRLAAKGRVQPELADKILKLMVAASSIPTRPVRKQGGQTNLPILQIQNSKFKYFSRLSLTVGARYQPPPKSLGREQFNAAFLDQVLTLARGLGTPDLLATAGDAVARRLSWPIQAWGKIHGKAAAAEVILAGGGCRNAALVSAIRRHLPGLSVQSIESALGIPAEAKEAVSFALLALANLDNIPANLPAVTGAGRKVVLGVRVPAGAINVENDHETL